MTKAIVLADEKSKRVVNGSGYMKAMAKVAGVPLIIRNLRTLHAAGVDDAVVVTGYQSEKVRRALDSYHLDIPVTVIHNRDWQLGSAHSLIAAQAWIDQPVILVPSDHLYPPSLIRRIMGAPAAVDSVVLAVDTRKDEVFDEDECLKVRVDGNRIIDVGMHIADAEGVCPGLVRVSPELVARMRRYVDDVDITLVDALRAMARRGGLRALDVENVRWVSISSPQARRYAELLLQLHGDTLETSYHGEEAVLLNPGPVSTTPRVKAAVGARDMCHREPIFSNLLDSVQRKLKTVFRASEKHDVYVITASGTGGVEATVSTFVPKGKKMLVLVNGAFGERIVEIAAVYGIEVVPLTVSWGDPLPMDALDAALAEDTDIAAVGMVHHETSMAILNPIGEVGRLARKHNRMLFVDAVSSLGAEDVDVVRDCIDVCVTSANKCLHAFSGLASVCVAPRVWSFIEGDSPRSFYLDLRKYKAFMTSRSQTPFTPGVNTMMSLNAALDELLDTGVASRAAHYRNLSHRLRTGLLSLGLDLMVDHERSSHSVTLVKVPEGMTYGSVYQGLKKNGFVVYECKGELAGKYFQVANMGALEEVHIDEFLAAMGSVLVESHQQESSFENTIAAVR